MLIDCLKKIKGFTPEEVEEMTSAYTSAVEGGASKYEASIEAVTGYHKGLVEQFKVIRPVRYKAPKKPPYTIPDEVVVEEEPVKEVVAKKPVEKRPVEKVATAPDVTTTVEKDATTQEPLRAIPSNPLDGIITKDGIVRVKQLPPPLHGKTTLEQTLSNGRGINAEKDADFLEGLPRDAEIFGNLSIPTQRTVVAHMLRAIKNRKIRDVVIEFVPVDVVDNLRRVKSPSQVTFHDGTVFKHSLAVDTDHNVSISIDSVARLIDAIALARTERVAGTLHPRRGSRDLDTTLHTNDGLRGIAKAETEPRGTPSAAKSQATLRGARAAEKPNSAVGTLKIGRDWHDGIIELKDGERQINYERVQDVARRVEEGSAEIRYLNPEVERGRIAGGRRNVEASIILAANERASEESGSRTPPVKRQERILEDYAKQAGIWFDIKKFTGEQQGFIRKGQEAYVHRSADGKSVYKLVDYKGVNDRMTPLAFIDKRISLFNYLFPDTAYELTGFTRDSGGKFRFIVKQPFVQDVVYTLPVERAKFMDSKGFQMTSQYGESFATPLYYVGDLHEKNALKGTDGTIYVIDAVPDLDAALYQPFDVTTTVEKDASTQETPEPLRSVPDENFGQSDYTFKESDYRPSVVEWAKEKFGDRVAPNGKPVYQNFIRWFGDSQVVNEKGEPLVVYHGTLSNFDTFDASQSTNTDRAISRLLGFFFTRDVSDAARYAKWNYGEGSVVPAYLAIRNPYEMSYAEFDELNMYEFNRMKASNYQFSEAEEKKWAKEAKNSARGLRSRLTQQGFDGILIKSAKGRTLEVVAFTPTQIKSAIGNTGDFSPEEGSILRQVPGSPFYSRVESIIKDKMPNRASKAQVEALLAKNGVKELDPEFQALKVWMPERVSKEDVLAFVEANKTVVSEVVKGGKDALERLDELEAKDTLTDVEEAERQTILNGEYGATDETSFAQWQLPGESENYREEFLTAPASAGIWKDGHSDYDSGVSELSAEEQSRFLEGIKPNRLRETVKNFFGAKIAANFPLKGVESSVIPALHYDQVRRAIVAALPVDVVNVLSDNGISTEDVGGNFTVLEKNLPPDVFSRVSRAIRIASGEIGTLFGTRLSNSLSRGVDETLLPALRTSDLDSSTVFQTLSQLSRGNLGSSISRVESRSASSGAKNFTGSRDGLTTSFAGSDRLSNRGIPADTPTEPSLRSGNGFNATEGTQTGTASGGFVTSPTAILPSGGGRLNPADLTRFVNTHQSILAQKRGDIVNPIVRVRYNDRTTTDGDKMLFGEEIQQPSKDNLAKMPKVYQKFGEEMAIRKMLYRAVEGDYDYFGFTTGQQQADRYDLSKKVKEVNWQENKDGSFNISPIMLDGSPIPQRSAGELSNLKPEDLDGVIGKEAADKIREHHGLEWAGRDVKQGKLTNLDLKVGGEGLIARYDRKHVDYINKLMKPYGVRVESKEIQTVPTSSGDVASRTSWQNARVVPETFGDGTETGSYEVFATRKDNGKEHRIGTFDSKAEADAEAAYLTGNGKTETVHAVRISPEFKAAVKAAMRDHGGAFPLFKQPENRADLNELKTKYLDELAPDVKTEYKGENVVEINAEASELIRTALSIVMDTPREAQAVIGSLFTEPQNAANLIEAIDETGLVLEEAGIDAKQVKALVKNIEKASESDGTVIFDGGGLEHEKVHYSSWKGADGKLLVDRYANIDEIAKDKDFKQFWGELNKLQGKSNIGVAAEEALAYLGSGDYARFGLTEEQAVGILQKLVNGYAEANGVESLRHFEAEKIYEAIENLTKGESSQTGDDSRGAVGEEREAGPRPAEAESDQTSAQERFAPGGPEKLSKSPTTMRGNVAAFEEVEDRTYLSTTNDERQEFANSILDKGITHARNWLDEQIKNGDNNAGATQAVGLTLMNHYAQNGGVEAMNEIAKKIITKGTDNAQAVQAMSMVSQFDPASAAAYASLLKQRKTGKDLTNAERQKATDLATTLSETAKVEGIGDAVQQDLENYINELTAENEAIKEALADKPSESKTDVANLKRQLTRWKNKALGLSDTAGRMTRTHSELLGRKSDILERLRQKFPDAVLRMVAKPERPLVAPNGKPSNLSPELHKMVRTKAFKNWFGDWETLAKEGQSVWADDGVSKVVDENGEPRVVFHGTKQGGFGIFSTGSNSKVPDTYWFTSDRDSARSYSGGVWGDATIAKDPEAYGNEDFEGDEIVPHEGIYSVFLNIRSPYESYFEGANWDGTRDERKYYVSSSEEYTEGEPFYAESGSQFVTREEAEELLERAKKERPEEDWTILEEEYHHETTDSAAQEGKRYGDGTIIHDVTDSGSDLDFFEPVTVYVANKPNQIKSIFNEGTFDAKDAHILRSVPSNFDDATRQDLIDYAALNILEGKSYDDVIKHLNDVTKGVLNEAEVKSIHANAVMAIRGKRPSTTMDEATRQKIKNRNEHIREAKRFQGANKNPNLSRLEREIANIATDDKVRISAIIQTRTPDLKTWNDLISEVYDLDKTETRELYRQGRELRDEAKKNLETLRRQNETEIKLSEDDLARIKEERRVNNALASKTRREADNFYNGLVRSRADVVADTIVNARRANLLTGIKTHFKNILGNTVFGATEELQRPVAWLADRGVGIVTGEKTVGGINPKSILNSFYNTVAKDEVFKNIDKETGLEAAKHILRFGDSQENMERMQHSESVLAEKYPGRPAKWIDNYINGVFRTLGAEDAIFKVYAFRRSLEEQATALAKTEDRKNWRARRDELLRHPTETMQIVASDFANFMTFQNDNVLSNLFTKFKRLHPGVRTGAETIVPYDRTPTNIVMRVAEHLPIAGQAIAAKQLLDLRRGPDKPFRNRYRGAVQTDLMTSEQWNALDDNAKRKAIDDGIANVWSREKQAKFARTVGRSSLGSSLFFTGFGLAALGLLTGSMAPEDDDKKETNEFFDRRSKGIENKSLLIPGVGRFVLPDDPASKTVAAGATFYEQMMMSKGDFASKAWGAAGEVTKDAMFEQPLMGNVGQLYHTIKKGRYGEFAGQLAGGMVPTMVSDVGEVLDDKARTTSGYRPRVPGKPFTTMDRLAQQGRGFRNSFLRRIPIVRQFADESKNVPSEIRGGILRRAARMIDPFNIRPATPYTPPEAKPSMDNYLKSPEFKKSTTDDLVDVLMMDDMPASDRDKLKAELEKKANSAHRRGTLTPDELKRVQKVLPDFNITANDKNVKR